MGECFFDTSWRERHESAASVSKLEWPIRCTSHLVAGYCGSKNGSPLGGIIFEVRAMPATTSLSACKRGRAETENTAMRQANGKGHHQHTEPSSSCCHFRHINNCIWASMHAVYSPCWAPSPRSSLKYHREPFDDLIPEENQEDCRCCMTDLRYQPDLCVAVKNNSVAARTTPSIPQLHDSL